MTAFVEKIETIYKQTRLIQRFAQKYFQITDMLFFLLQIFHRYHFCSLLFLPTAIMSNCTLCDHLHMLKATNHRPEPRASVGQ